jgi:hypothetical protein
LGSCRWAFVLSLSCKGIPSKCGPWNGYCAERSAYLKEKGLTEPPPWTAEAEELHRVFKANGDRHIGRPPRLERKNTDERVQWRGAANEGLSEAEKARARAEQMRKDMKQWVKRCSLERDFGRER